MAKVIFTEELIKKDLLSLRDQVLEIKPQFDYIKLVKPMLDKLGYDYDFNEQSGGFTMCLADGIQIQGVHHQDYEIRTSISLKGIQCIEWIFEIKFGTFESYAPRFKILIDKLLSLKERYYQMIKDDAATNLFSTAFVEPLLSQLKLKKSEVYSAQGNASGMIVEVPLFANIRFKTIVNEDNYQERCKELALAVKSMPRCILSVYAKNMSFYVTRNPKGECADGTLFNPSKFPHVSYNDGTMSREWPMAPSSTSANSLYEALSEMGYVYYLDESDLIVRLNDSHCLRRDGTTHKTCLSFDKGGRDWERVVLHDMELIYYLRMYCQASSESRFEGYCMTDFSAFIIKKLLPQGSRFSLSCRQGSLMYVDTTVGHNMAVYFSGYGIKMARQLWYLFTNWTFFANWNEYMQRYPNIQIAFT